MARADTKSSGDHVCCLKSFLTAIAVVAVLYALATPVTAAVVVQSIDDDESTTGQGLPGLPGATAPATETPPTITAPPASEQSGSAAAPAPQPAPAAAPTMPVPPTYAPGTPAATARGEAGQGASELPAPPTGYGLYDSNPTMPAPGGLGGQPQSMPGSPLGIMPPDPTSVPMEPNAMPQTAAQPPAQVPQYRQPMSRGSKPFSSYSAPPAYSPYMNLFRSDSTSRGINNYYQYVKPVIDQRRQNAIDNREIQNLQNAVHTDTRALKQMKQRPGNVLPTSAPQAPATFMNYQQYYPQYQGR